MDPLNINRFGGNQSNYRLRNEPVKLHCREYVGVRPDGDGYEQVWSETDTTERHRSRVKPGMPRKQRAALAAMPKATVVVVPVMVARPIGVVEAVLAKKTPQEVRIVELEAKIRELRERLKVGR